MIEKLNQINIRLQELKSKSKVNINDVWEIIDLEDLRDEILFKINTEEQEYKNID